MLSPVCKIGDRVAANEVENMIIGALSSRAHIPPNRDWTLSLTYGRPLNGLKAEEWLAQLEFL
jgi:hypothetical protein